MTTRFNRVTRIAFACLLIVSLTVVSSVPAIALSTTTTLEESPLSLSGGPSAGVTPTLPETGSQLKDDVLPGDSEPVRIAQNDESVPVFIYPVAVLWDNGPLVTHPGGGYNGADASVVQTVSGMSTYGFGNQLSEGNRMADDFVITGLTDWEIENITFFAYQTGSPTNPSTITGVYFQIWNGSPDDPGSSIVWGDLTTNRLISSTWTNIYRTIDTSLANSDRPIMANIASVGIILSPGVYWIDWTTDGSLTSGPWATPITILGQTSTGNAMQFTDAWAPALDTGTSTAQGMPFIIQGIVYESPAVVVYVPSILKSPIIPPAPILNAISNDDGDGSYTINWSSSIGADTYTSEEDDNIDFSSPTTVYSGSSTSYDISGKDIGTYYYHIKASNAYASSDWSNIESVEVTVPPPECPQVGSWTGWTNQGEPINFVVTDTPNCKVASLDISYGTHCENGGSTFEHEHLPSVSITNNHFTSVLLNPYTVVHGDFGSSTSATGSWSANFIHPVNGQCTGSGSWSAEP